ncbi:MULTISPECIES: plasmid partitioning protein RepB C-terminal domain-containing protein [unclassified Mesorhizobium]|uniref:plasmid partitioning protein RepB C-terminal domain-containing protein n=1 Tax=unclassified Mesorhizobium TaxID=325217 RepID=UPI001FF03A46|nr:MULTISPECIES: plasmid partitioning protein RepB C-terminal domain-containing protein [unclassified Mesorhizobium]
MRRFVEGANAVQSCLDSVADALHQVLFDPAFRTMLHTEGFATIPSTLTRERSADRRPVDDAHERPTALEVHAEQQLVFGICVEALDLLKDFGVPPGILGLLREVAPVRQVEIAQLMIAMDAVQFENAKVLVALTSRSQLANRHAQRKRYAGIDNSQLVEMETGLAQISRRYLDAVNCHGARVLRLIAATKYFDRLMNNARLVRYLARNFPRHFEEFQKLLDFQED